MSKMVAAVGVFILFVGLVVALAPEHLTSLIDWGSRKGAYTAASVRMVLGALLFLGAPASKFPRGLRTLGVLVVVAAFGILLIPSEIWMRLMSWWTVQRSPLFRFGGGAGGILFGAFLVYAARPGAIPTTRT